MKHLFFVHSHITFLVANQYIIDKNIEQSNCLFVLCSRYKHLPDGCHYSNTIMTPSGLLPNNCTRVLVNGNILKGIRNIHYVENKVNQFCKGDKFYLYLPNTGSDVHNAIVTMSQCLGYYLIEEGTASYLSKNEVPLLFHGLRQRLMLILTKVIPRFFALKSSCFAFDNKYFLGTISTSIRAFCDYPEEHLLTSPPFKKVHIEDIPDVILSVDYSILLTIGPSFPDKLYKSIYTFFRKQHYGKIAVKFHPAYYSDPSVLDVFKNGLISVFGDDMMELDQKCIVEDVLYTYPIAFCSDLSSIGIYAANFNRLCYSYFNLFVSLYPQCGYSEKFGNSIPKIMCESYTMIPVEGFED